MFVVLGIIIGLVILTIIVATHEFGHGLAAKRSGVVVEEFGIGFPPRATSRVIKKSILGKNVRYSLNWLPIGGFVKLQGEHDTDGDTGDYGAATFWQKTKILLAGVAVNWLTAVVLLTILALFGIPQVIDNQFTVKNDTHQNRSLPTVNYVSEGSPGAEAGLKLGDELVKVDGRSLASAGQLSEITEQRRGQPLEITYKRGGQTFMTTAHLRDNNDNGQGYLGVSDIQRSTLRATWSAPIVGFGLTWQLTSATYQGLGQMVASLAQGIVHKFSSSEQSQKEASRELSTAKNSVAGPVGLLGSILPAFVQAGPSYVILLMAIIAISLAAINILPLPALDGGRFFLTAIFRAIKKPLSAEIEERINGYGMMFLLLLIVVITIVDVSRFF